jgi:glycosyltransferase involved in cell wall biosynthesis
VLDISVYIICFNEQSVIADCIKSVSFSNDIVVVDSGSTDATKEIIHILISEGLPIRFIEQAWLGFSSQKQFALEQCKNDWCLNVDADERADAELAVAVASITADTTIDGWAIKRRDRLHGYGYQHTLSHHKYHLRLVRKNKAHYPLDVKVHEQMVVDGKIARMTQGKILHLADIDVIDATRKRATYARLKAQQKFENGKSKSLGRLIFLPFLSFIKAFIFHRFFLMGSAGLVHSGSIACYSFLTEAALFDLANTKSGKIMDIKKN